MYERASRLDRIDDMRVRNMRRNERRHLCEYPNERRSYPDRVAACSPRGQTTYAGLNAQHMLSHSSFMRRGERCTRRVVLRSIARSFAVWIMRPAPRSSVDYSRLQPKPENSGGLPHSTIVVDGRCLYVIPDQKLQIHPLRRHLGRRATPSRLLTINAFALGSTAVDLREVSS